MMDCSMNSNYQEEPTKLQLCLNCMNPCTMNMPLRKSELDEAEDTTGQVYLMRYKFNTRNSETGTEEVKTVIMSNIEALTCIFDLPPPDVTRLINLQVNSMLMCDNCTQVLASVFKARHEFQQLTSDNSRLCSVFKSDDCSTYRLRKRSRLKGSDGSASPIICGPEYSFCDPEELEGHAVAFSNLAECTSKSKSIERGELKSWMINLEAQGSQKTKRQLMYKRSKNRKTKKIPAKAKVKYPKPKKEVKCPKCDEVFRSSYPSTALRRHNEFKHGQPPAHPCDICGRPEGSQAHVNSHRLTHFSQEERAGLTFLCTECGKQLTTEYGLKIHISHVHRRNFKYPEYNCEKCGSKSSSMRSHNMHMRKHEIEEGDTYYFFCKLCPAKFKFNEELRMHHPACPGEAHLRPQVCPECSRRFKLKQSLELHLNEVHKYDAIAAREFVYPGLGPRKFLTRAEWKRKKKESQT